MELNKIKSQMRKGVLEMCVLAILHDREYYPSEILEALKKNDLIVVEGTLYPLLTRLKNEGMLNYRWEESTGGPPRKYYKITRDGEQVLSSLVGSWKELAKTIERIIK
jgi:PadR family transcriptional regulator PadR